MTTVLRVLLVPVVLLGWISFNLFEVFEGLPMRVLFGIAGGKTRTPC